MASSKKPPRWECINCHCEIGPNTDEIPVTIQDDGGEGGGKDERWCSQCFVYVRTILDPVRYTIGRYFPIACAACGKRSVSIGKRSCMQCNSPRTILLGPKPGAV